MFLITVPRFADSFRRTLHRRAGGGKEMGRGRRRNYDLSSKDALQTILWHFVSKSSFLKFACSLIDKCEF